MILAIILLVIALGLITWRYVVIYKEVRTLRKITHFSNIIPRRQYAQLADWLRKRKSKFSLKSKMDLLTMWYGIIMTMPKEYSIALNDISDLVNVKDDIPQTRWKQMLINKLEELQQMEDLDLDYLSDLSFYIFNIIFR